MCALGCAESARSICIVAPMNTKPRAPQVGQGAPCEPQSPAPLGQPAEPRGFASPEGLRQLLFRLSGAGPDAWATDPEAEALLEYCPHRFGALARRYRQTPHDAAVAAFEVLRAAATVRADDPWAVVTRAVELTVQANERADALLCSTGKARRLMSGGHHDVVRFGERDDGDRSWTDHLDAATDVRRRSSDDSSGGPSPVNGVAPGEVPVAVANVVELLVALGWPRAVATNGLDYICSRLAEAGNPATAFEYLRRDLTPLTLLDIPHRSWTALCRIVLGPDDGLGQVTGLLRRVLSGEPIATLLADQKLVGQVARSSPSGHRAIVPATDRSAMTRTVRNA